jgi:hypothetical protein
MISTLAFIHYGFMTFKERGYSTPFVDILRYSICFFLFYYYLDKASGLLSNNKKILKFLRRLYTLGLLILLVGVVIFLCLYKPGPNAANKVVWFIVFFKAIPLIMIGLEFIILL